MAFPISSVTSRFRAIKDRFSKSSSKVTPGVNLKSTQGSEIFNSFTPRKSGNNNKIKTCTKKLRSLAPGFKKETNVMYEPIEKWKEEAISKNREEQRTYEAVGKQIYSTIKARRSTLDLSKCFESPKYLANNESLTLPPELLLPQAELLEQAGIKKIKTSESELTVNELAAFQRQSQLIKDEILSKKKEIKEKEMIRQFIQDTIYCREEVREIKVTDWKTEVTQLKKDITQPKEKVNQLEGEISRLKGKINQLKKEIIQSHN